MRKKFSPGQGNVLVIMSYLVFDHPETNPCTTFLRNMRAHGTSQERLVEIRRDIRSLRGIGSQMQRFVKELRAKRPWTDKIKSPEKMLAVFAKRMAAYYGQDAKPREDLSSDEATALNVIQWRLQLRLMPRLRRSRLQELELQKSLRLAAPFRPLSYMDI